MHHRLAILLLPTLIAAAPAHAKEAAFTGNYAGPEIGAHEHHFFLETTELATGRTTGRYSRKWSIGGGAFAGHDVAVGRRIRLGGEIGVSVGGDGPVARFGGDSYARDPRWGYRATVHAGYIFADRLMAYGTVGYGGHKYRTRDTIGVTSDRDWGDSFVIGGGLQYRVAPRVDVRLDFRHLDNQMSSILIGVPIRF